MEDNKDLIRDKIAVSEITEKEWKKVRNDLRFISIMAQLAKENGCRLIVSGGYAVDGCLGRITRPHRDIDIQVYGQGSGSEQLVRTFIEGVKESEATLSKVELRDKGRQEFYHSYFAEGNGLGSDIYYIQVKGNPFDQEKYVVKKDGSCTESQKYDTVEVSLEGTTFEAIDPTSELVDKLYKRQIRGDKSKPEHNQDITNLRLITDAKEVESRLTLLTQQE